MKGLEGIIKFEKLIEAKKVIQYNKGQNNNYKELKPKKRTKVQTDKNKNNKQGTKNKQERRTKKIKKKL